MNGKFTVLLLAITSAIFLTVVTLVRAATTPDLGQAASFAILADTYTNTVVGTTITGDLGYTTGPATAPTVNGTTHIADGTYSQAGTDQGAALSVLNSEPCDFNFGSPTDLSLLSQPLAPGVYCVTGAASIGSGGITLSGSGTYIFRIDGALTTVDNSIVTLAGGATACDVFWTPTSATTLGANTIFMGTDIDDSGITIGSTTTWTGRALAFGGTVTTDADTITAPSCPAPTATPASASSSSVSSSTTSSGGSSSCPDLDSQVVAPNIISSTRVDSDSILISWGPYSGVNTFNIRYGTVNGDWLYNTDVTGFSTTINNLPANTPIWVQVAARNDCMIGTYGAASFVGGVSLSNPLIPLLPNTGIGPNEK